MARAQAGAWAAGREPRPTMSGFIVMDGAQGDADA